MPCRLTFMQQWGTHCHLRFLFLLALVLGKPFLEPSPKTVFLGELVAEVADLPPIAVDIIVLDIAKIVCNVKLFGERLADISMDVVHSSGPHMVQPFFKPGGVSTKLTCTGTDGQVFQISGTLVACVLMAQHSEVGHGSKFPCRMSFVLTKQVIYAGHR